MITHKQMISDSLRFHAQTGTCSNDDDETVSYEDWFIDYMHDHETSTNLISAHLVDGTLDISVPNAATLKRFPDLMSTFLSLIHVTNGS